MSAIEDLERAADGGLPMRHPPGARTREPGPVAGMTGELDARLRSIEVRLSHVMDLVSVLCMRLNITAEEVGDAHAANSKAASAKGGIA